MEVFCVFQRILDCSNDDELVDAPLTLEVLDRQQSQVRCKSWPKANTHAVKYSNPWIPSEKKTKAQLQTTKKKQWVG